MTQKNLSYMLRGLVAVTAVAGLFLCRFVIRLGALAAGFSDRQQFFLPCLIFFIASAAVAYLALFFAWRIFADIGRDLSFTRTNARRLKRIAGLFLLDTVVYVLALGLLELLTQLDELTVALMLGVAFVGLALTLISACLSHLVLKAAALKQENELTI